MNETFKMSWRAGDWIVFWLCFIAVSEAALLANCNENDSSNCTAIIESCISDSCACSGGHFNVSNVCKSSSITVTLPTQSISVVYGSDVELIASITSEVPLNPIKWLIGSTELVIVTPKYTQNGVGPETVTLTIHNVDFFDSGNYQVEVSNLAGITSTSNQVLLTVTGEKPTVTLPWTITETDTTVTIHCTVSVSQGSPALTSVYWLLNGQNLDILDSAKYSGGTVNTTSLSINNIGPTDAGEYRCGANNLLASSNSSQSVTLAAPTVVTISKQPAGPVNYNSSVTFTGSYTSDLLSVTIKWQKMTGGNFMDIDITTDKYTGSSVTGPSPELRINPVKLIDETSYRLEVSNGVGSTSSNLISLNMIGGNLTVSTGANVTGRFGGSVTIDCTVTGPEVNKIQWMKYINNNPEDISIDGQKFTGGFVDTKALTINSLTNNDALYQYQCTASNPRGVFKSANTATVTVKYGQFDEDCSNSEPCDTDKYLACTNSKCLCMNTYYHKDQVCYPISGIASTVIALNRETNNFSIFWNNPSTDYELIFGYEVKWRVKGFMEDSSGQLSRTVNQYTASSNLTPGQLYIVIVISHVTLTNPADSFVVASSDKKVRLVPLPPGPILRGSSNFAYDNLIIKWTAPANNTFVTKYRVSVDGTTQQTSSYKPEIHFIAKDLTPGMNYTVKIVTVSGTTDDVQESSVLNETIRITPTKPGPPTDVRCPESPLDVSLEISWKAPTNPNGRIDQYLINIKEEPRTIPTSSDQTIKKIEGLYPEQTYTFTVQTINDAAESIRVSDPSSPVACNTKAGGNLTVTTGADVTGRLGGSVTIDCTVTGLELNNIQWKRHINSNPEDISIDGQKFTGGFVDTKALTINSLTNNDALYQYQCTASNPRGVFKSANTATVTVKYGQFDENCSNSEPCDTDKYLACTNSKCLCINTYYHKDQVCYPKAGLSPTNIFLNSTTNMFFVSWSNPTSDYELFSGYEVTWRFLGSSFNSSGPLVKNVNQYNVSSGLISGQLYTVTVMSKVTLTNPAGSFVQPSPDTPVRLVPSAPGPVIPSQSNFAHDNLQIKWTAPVNTVVTKYEVSLDGTTYTTMSSDAMFQFTGKVFVPGHLYVISIITVSGTTSDIVKKSSNHTEWIRTTPTMSSAPTNLNIDGIKSREFRIQFNRPDGVSGILAAYKIVISERGNCVQQILVHGICSICKSTVGCPPPINYTVPDITNNNVSYTASRLDPYSHYVVKVVAINGEGEGHPVNETVRTDEEVPLQPEQITASNVQSSSLTLAWTLPDPSPGNTTYTIYIYEGIDDNGTSFLMKESIKVYGFETKMLSVTGLEEYWPYKFQVNAATVKGNTTSDFSSVFQTKEAVVKDDETTSTSSIIGSVVAVILVVAGVVIGIFIWKRNRRQKEYKERANTYADLKLDERTKVDQPYSFLEHGSRTVNSKSVPLNSFYDYVVDLLNNSRQKLTKEYHDLLHATERSALTVASSKDNVSKNRGNIIPYDFNRVRLCSPGASDYIDASVLLDKCYILTSYPITKTFGNFWQMVWEQNVSTIVVMTGHSDDRESWYFSDNEGTVRTMERIDVELLAKFKSSESVTMRKIKLSRGKHSKVVNHFHVISLEMTDLPDQILALINSVTQNNVKNTGPQVVHGGCTGVDNSGVYIAVDHAVKSVGSGGNEIDVYGTARAVMKERMFSISSLEQYSAIYTCLQKYVQNSPACKNDATGTYEYLP